MRVDYQAHLFLGTFLSMFGVINKWLILLGFIGGALKEAYDFFIGTGEFDWWDIWYTWIGASIAMVFVFSISFLRG